MRRRTKVRNYASIQILAYRTSLIRHAACSHSITVAIDIIAMNGYITNQELMSGEEVSIAIVIKWLHAACRINDNVDHKHCV